MPIDFKSRREEIAGVLQEFCNRWCKREHVESNALNSWKLNTFKIIDGRISFYCNNFDLLPPNPKFTFESPKPKFPPVIVFQAILIKILLWNSTRCRVSSSRYQSIMFTQFSNIKMLFQYLYLDFRYSDCYSQLSKNYFGIQTIAEYQVFKASF